MRNYPISSLYMTSVNSVLVSLLSQSLVHFVHYEPSWPNMATLSRLQKTHWCCPLLIIQSMESGLHPINTVSSSLDWHFILSLHFVGKEKRKHSLPSCHIAYCTNTLYCLCVCMCAHTGLHGEWRGGGDTGKERTAGVCPLFLLFIQHISWWWAEGFSPEQ